MIGFTLHHVSVGTKCFSLVRRIGQPAILQSQLHASYALNKLVPFEHTHFIHTKKGDSAVCQRRLKFLQTKCDTLVHISHLPLQSWNSELFPVLRTSLLSRTYATNGDKQTEQHKSEEHGFSEPEKLSLLQRFKQMYRDYWYVLVPVHLITSLGWFAGFYYLAKSGVDVIALLESMGISDKVINPLRDSSAGYIALAYALYKIATPLRYTVTLGGTTISINYLKEWGYIRPIPPREKLKEMYQEKKATLIRETTEELRLQQEKLKKTRETVMRGYRKSATKPEK